MRLPKNPFHPDEMLLEEVFVPVKMPQAALAKAWLDTGVPERADQREARHYGGVCPGSGACTWHVRETLNESSGDVRS